MPPQDPAQGPTFPPGDPRRTTASPSTYWDLMQRRDQAPRPTADQPSVYYPGLQVDPLQQSLTQAAQTPTDRARRILELRRLTGIPAALIEPNFDELDKRAKAGALDPADLRQLSPSLAAWLADPPNAAAALPNVKQLQNFEGLMKVGTNFLIGIQNAEGNLYGLLDWVGDVTGSRELNRISREGMDRNRLEARAYGAPQDFQTAFQGPAELASFVALNLPSTIPTVVSSAVTAYLTGGASLAVWLGAAVPALALGVGEVQSEVKELDPLASSPGLVLAGGSAIAALDMFFPKRMGSKLARTFGPAFAEKVAERALAQSVKPKFWRVTAGGLVTGFASEAIPEAIQEAIGYFTARQVTGAPMSWAELGPRMAEAFVGGGLTGGLIESSWEAATIRRQQRRWSAAQQQKDFFDALGKGTAEIELLAKLPDAGREFFQEVTRDGPLETIYVDTDVWRSYWEAQGENPEAMAKVATGRDNALEQAEADKTKLALKTADYAARIAGGEHHTFFAPELRFGPDLPNAREMKAERDQAIAAAQAEVAKLTAERVTEREAIAKAWVDKAVEGGVPRFQAEQVAAVWVAYYQSGADIAGVPLRQYFERLPIEVIVRHAGQVMPATAGRMGGDQASIDPLAAVPNKAFVPAKALAGAFAGVGAEPSAEALLSDEALQRARLTPDAEAKARAEAEIERRTTAPAINSVFLETAGFSPEEIQALQAAGLATGGTMTRDQYQAWVAERVRRLEQPERPAVQAPLRLGLPPSVASPGETNAQRVQREATHTAALVSEAVRDARALDPTVDPERLKQEILARLRYDREQREMNRESGVGQTLLKAIARLGGIWFNERTGGEADEIIHYAKEGRDRKDRGERGGRAARQYDEREWEDIKTGTTTRGVQATWNGVPGVFGKGGKTPDDMLRDLRQDGEYQDITTIPELFDAIDAAIRAGQDRDELPGSQGMRELGVVPGTRWWDDSWLAPPPSEGEPTGGDDWRASQPTGLEARTVEELREMLNARNEWTRANALEELRRRQTRDDDTALNPDDLRDAADQLEDDGEEPTFDPSDFEQRTRPASYQVWVRDGNTWRVEDSYPTRAEAEEHLTRAVGQDQLRRGIVARPAREFEQLTPETTPKGWGWVAPHLFPSETRNLNALGAQNLLDAFKRLPHDSVFEAAAIAGRAKKGWYEKSRKAIYEVFGPIDGNRFIALLAALSPRTDVGTDLLNSVRMWRNWNEAGRPTDTKRITELLAASVRGQGEASILPTWLPNVLRALQAPDGIQIVLSGPKVASFAWNLYGYVHEVTLDAWMGYVAGRQFALSGASMRPSGDDPGKTPSYKAYAAKIRRVAKNLTEQTGEVWTPENVQETVWSWAYVVLNTARTLKKLRGTDISAVELVKHGIPSSWMLNEVPDFEQLLAQNGEIQSILKHVDLLGKTHYAEALAKIGKAFARRPGRHRGGPSFGLGQPVSGPPPRPSSALLRAAANLEEWRQFQLAEAEETRAANAEKATRARVAARRSRDEAFAEADSGESAGEFYMEAPPPAPASERLYSRIVRLVTDLGQGKQTGALWKQFLRNNKSIGANKFELEFVALELLDDHTTYTKQALLDHVAAHRVALEEVQLVPPELVGELVPPQEVEEETRRIYNQRVEAEALYRIGSLNGPYFTVDLATYQVPEGGDWYYSVSDVQRTREGFATKEDAWAAGQEWMRLENERKRADAYAEAVNVVDWSQAEQDARVTVAERYATRKVQFSEYVEPGAIDGSYREFFITAPHYGTLAMRQDSILFKVRSDLESQVTGDFADRWTSASLIRPAVAILDKVMQLRLNRGPGTLFTEADFTDRGEFVFLSAEENRVLDTGIQAAGFRGGLKASLIQVLAKVARADEAGIMDTRLREFTWQDGHGVYNHIKNPIVRVRLNARELPGAIIPPEAMEIEDGVWEVYLPGQVSARVSFPTEAEANAWIASIRYNDYTPVQLPNGDVRQVWIEPTYGEPVGKVLFLETVQHPKDHGPNEFARMPAIYRKHAYDLAMRWAIQHAAIHGYTHVAWTTGDMQLKRWSGERKFANPLVYYPDLEQLAAYQHAGSRALWRKFDVKPEDVGRVLGDDDLAARLLDPANLDEVPWGLAQTGPTYTLQVTGQQFGGQGLANTYDKTLVKATEEIPVVKKRKLKVGTITLPQVAWEMRYLEGRPITADTLAEKLADPDGNVFGMYTDFAANLQAMMARHGLTFEQTFAHVTVGGSIGFEHIAQKFGGRVTKRRVAAEVPALALTPDLTAELLGQGSELFQEDIPWSGVGPRMDPSLPYQQTMFGDPIPPAPPVDRATFTTRAELRTQSRRQLGADVVRSPRDLAAAMSSLALSTVERVEGLVTDADGRPLAIVGGFKGTFSEARVYGEVLVAEAIQVPGAARVWLAHNHPSGNPTLSPADLELNQSLKTRFADSGIAYQGVMAIGAGTGSRRFEFAGPDYNAATLKVPREQGTVPTGQIAFTHVPVVEREFVTTDKMTTPVTSPVVARNVVPALLKGQFGIVFTDANGSPTATKPMDPTATEELRTEGRLAALLTDVSLAGAPQAFIHSTSLATQTAALNLANALHAQGIRVVDIVGPDNQIQTSPTSHTGVFREEDQPTRRKMGAYDPLLKRISIFAESATLATLLHESGHAFLEERMGLALQYETDLAAATELQRKAVRDMHAVLRWFGFEGSIGQWLALSIDQRRAMHEKWARGSEVYFATAKAPSEELRPAFAAFRTWIGAAYKLIRRFGRITQGTAEQAIGQAAGFKVELPEEIRQVMDRLFASDEAIATAQAEGQHVSLFTDAASAGVDELTWAAHLALMEEGHIKGREQLDRRLLADWRRERQADWQRKREQKRQAVEAESHNDPKYVALSVMRTGKMPDGSIPSFGDGAPMKLSRAAIVAMKGTAFLATLPRPYIYVREGGLHPDVVAELTGFTSGDAMLDALVGVRPQRQVVDEETDARMREDEGDAMLDGIELQGLAEAAIYENRAEIISAELKMLTQGMALKLPSAAALRAAAEQRIQATAVRDLRPGLFLEAARRASKRAFEAWSRNDRRGAIQARQDELTTLALYKAASDARDRSQRSARILGEFQTSPGRRRTLLRAGQDYLDQVDGLLEQYEFTKTTLRVQDRRENLATWVAKQIEKGLPLQMPAWLLSDMRRINYTQLSVEELEGLRQSVEHLAHMARLKKRLLDARDQRELEEIQAEIAGSIHAHWQPKPLEEETHLPWQRTKTLTAGVLWSHRKLASIARELDGFQDGGPMWEFVIRRLNDAGNRELTMNGQALAALTAIYAKHYTRRERLAFSQKRATPELNVAGRPAASYTKGALLVMGLNQGNDTNKMRLRDSYGWTQDQVQLALDHHLDKRDWEFVQDVLDYLETYWPRIMEKQSRVTGVAPRKVQATPIFTRFGEFRGGYYPIAFNRQLSMRTLNLEDASIADMEKAAAYVHATTDRGHLEERVEGNVPDQKIRLDLNVIDQHLSKVIHDLTHHEVLIDVGRILDPSGPVAKAIQETKGTEAYRQFVVGMRDIALGEPPARNQVASALNYLRTGTTVVGLGLNFTTTALQIVGFNQSIHRIGAKWVGQGLVSYWRGALMMQGTMRGIRNESAFMANRWANISPEVHDVSARLGINTGKFTGWMEVALGSVSGDRLTKQGVANSFLWSIAKMQQFVDAPTYLGAKAKAAADPANRKADGTLDEARIIALAEQAVIDAQGAGQIKDLAAVQRMGPEFKIWTNFYSFFNTTYNLWAESMKRAGMRLAVNPRNPVAVGRLAVDYMLLFFVASAASDVLRDAIRGTLKGDWEDDPEGYVWQLTRNHVAYLANTMVLVREVGGAIEGGPFGYEGPAGIRGMASVSGLIKQIFQGEADEAFWRSLNTTAGIFFHYPAGFVDKVVRGFAALMEGETSNPLAPLAGPPPQRNR